MCKFFKVSFSSAVGHKVVLWMLLRGALAIVWEVYWDAGTFAVIVGAAVIRRGSLTRSDSLSFFVTLKGDGQLVFPVVSGRLKGVVTLLGLFSFGQLVQFDLDELFDQVIQIVASVHGARLVQLRRVLCPPVCAAVAGFVAARYAR